VLRSGDAQLDPSYSSDFAAELLPYQENVISLKQLIIKHREDINNFVSSPPAGIKKTSTPFRKGTDVKFFNELEAFIDNPESPSGSLGALSYFSSEKLFSEAAFGKGKWIDLSTHTLAPVFKANSGGTNNGLYWPTTGWRKGDLSQGAISKSSVWVMEQMLEKLGNTHTY
jgi:hypothetical protein